MLHKRQIKRPDCIQCMWYILLVNCIDDNDDQQTDNQKSGSSIDNNADCAPQVKQGLKCSQWRWISLCNTNKHNIFLTAIARFTWLVADVKHQFIKRTDWRPQLAGLLACNSLLFVHPLRHSIPSKKDLKSHLISLTDHDNVHTDCASALAAVCKAYCTL